MPPLKMIYTLDFILGQANLFFCDISAARVLDISALGPAPSFFKVSDLQKI